MKEWEILRRRNPRARLVCLDIQPYADTQVKDDIHILVLGKALETEFARLQQSLPAGLELRKVSDQPAAVRTGVGEFIRVLAEALVIVLLVSFFSLGLSTILSSP